MFFVRMFYDYFHFTFLIKCFCPSKCKVNHTKPYLKDFTSYAASFSARINMKYLLFLGQSHIVGLLQPIIARVGDDIVLPCHLEPEEDVAGRILEWTRPDLNNMIVLVWRSSQEFLKAKHPSYAGRSSLFTDELKYGNISLKLSDVKLSDKGKYKCFIPDLDKQAVVEVIVGK